MLLEYFRGGKAVLIDMMQSFAESWTYIVVAFRAEWLSSSITPPHVCVQGSELRAAQK